ncbi:hypothetical protein [Photobacterium lutimaris]|uniref:Transcriptional regulator n=1 Tax=Photobacterium lutimaris TaxID=388278 RepID=A0A2T3J4L6_9GAMM|nr:hypothetical protein [Photobacterium lutimaris]PSU36237.1 hypothetical protein C9I99_04345 [Photobacterium lutimaris]TDR74887.1 hypothetical protein DFP78_106218 [Photobacterium lutimaris]
MKTITHWLEELKSVALSASWDEAANARLLNEAPSSLFGRVVNPTQSEAVAYWLDVCCRLSAYHQHAGNVDLAFRYQQFSYSKIQALASEPNQDTAIQRWCIKKLERMVVSMLEFCQQQPHPAWQNESKHLIESHVHFMQMLSHQNLSLGPVIKKIH